MKLIYVHGLDSSANSVKGQLMEEYCQINHPEIEVIRPDLNHAPDKVKRILCDYVLSEMGSDSSLSNHASQSNNQHTPVVLVGSSLGGYFSTLVSNETGCPALLLNPSISPHISLKRFIDTLDNDISSVEIDASTEIYRTTGGWSITLKDIAWFDNHQLDAINFPDKLFVLVKKGDELLDPYKSAEFYNKQGVEVCLQEGGDHRMSDFQNQLPMIIEKIKGITAL